VYVKFREEMEGDLRLMERKSHWHEVAATFQTAALGDGATPAKNFLKLCQFLNESLQLAEPEMKVNASATLIWHPAATQMLKVYHATEAAKAAIGLAPGQNIRDNTTFAAGKSAWAVMKTGEPELNNPHGLERDAATGRSMVPLRSIAGNTFGVLISGPPALPDELLELMGRQAGPLMERAWKAEKAREAVLSTIAFVKHITLEMRQLVYVDFKEGKTKTVDPFAAPATVWDWEPLKYQVKGFKKMELELKWRLGEPIGVMELTLGTFTQMDEQLLVLFHTVSALIESAVVDLEHLTPGDTPPLASQQAVLLEYSKARFGVADILQKEMEMQLLTFSPIPIFCEIASFEARALDFQQARALKSVFVLLGACTKSEAETMEWKGIKKICSRHVYLYEAMRSFCAPLDTREMRGLREDTCDL